MMSNYSNPIDTFFGIGESRFPIESSSQVINGVLRYVKAFPIYLTWWILPMFLLGLAGFYKLLIGMDLIFKNKEIQKQAFLMVWLITILLFIGITTSASYLELRYLLPCMPVVLIICAQGYMQAYNYLQKFETKLFTDEETKDD